MLLRLHPAPFGKPETRSASLGQTQDLAGPVGRVRLDRNQTVAFKGLDIAAKRRAIQDQLRGKRVDRHRALTLEPREYPILRRTQPDSSEIPVIELGDVAGGLPHGEAVAIVGIRKRSRGHGQPSSDTPALLPNLRAYTPSMSMLKPA